MSLRRLVQTGYSCQQQQGMLALLDDITLYGLWWAAVGGFGCLLIPFFLWPQISDTKGGCVLGAVDV